MPENGDVLKSLRDDVLDALQSNLVCLLHHGSRAKGEATSDSDYDSVIIARALGLYERSVSTCAFGSVNDRKKRVVGTCKVGLLAFVVSSGTCE